MFNPDVYLQSLTNWEPRLHQAGVSSFSLSRMEELLRAFGKPDDKLKFAHVAGSKGKGSTCVFLAEILRAAGYRTGLYTSPHLYSQRERLRILEPQAKPGLFEGCIPPDEFADRVRFYKDDIQALRAQGQDVTYYEVMTALAVSWFAMKKCDVVVLETGLGGRLDATNIFETSVCGITPIGLEHTAILGDTLGKIALEKAGIIKAPYQRVSLAPQEAEAMVVFQEQCARFGIIPTVIGKEMPVRVLSRGIDGVRFVVEGRREYGELVTALPGHHQALNAALGIALAEDLEPYGFLIEKDHVQTGIAAARWPCRFEILGRVIIDAAHTVESAEACARTFQDVFSGKKAILVFGTSLDKNAAGMARALLPVVSGVVGTKASHPRAGELTLAQLSSFFSGIPAELATGVEQALTKADGLAGPDGLVLVAGSIFLAAEARAYVSSGS